MSDPVKAPPHRTLHAEWDVAWKVTNCTGGAALAVHEHCGWIDNDATSSSNRVLVNDHGRPSTIWTGRRRIQEFTWAHLQTLVLRAPGRDYRLRTIAEAMRDNAAHGIKTEVEIKYIGPISDAELLIVMVQLCKDAEAAYGPDWREHMNVKVLTSLRGGTAYALRICKAAHDAGMAHGGHPVTTIILARNGARFNRFRGCSEVTYVRGSAVIR